LTPDPAGAKLDPHPEKSRKKENLPMDLRRCVWLPAIVLLIAVTVNGCSRKTPPPAPPPPSPPPVATAPVPPPAPPPQPPPQPPAQVQRPLTEDEVFARKTVDQLNAEMPLSDVMFDYDQFAIRDDQRGTLQKNADYLRRWPSVRVSIEGNTDLRGTNEYNLALGERRGNSARDYLTGLGLGADRFVVVSKGEESPVCTEDTEGCHGRNRRVHFVITAK
jgi:peptidoglycan-associated lipoprotein